MFPQQFRLIQIVRLDIPYIRSGVILLSIDSVLTCEMIALPLMINYEVVDIII